MAPVCGAPCQPEDSSGDSEASEASLLLELSELPVCWPHLLGSSEKADEGPKGQSHQVETLPELPGFPEVPEFEIEHIPSTPVRAVSEGATSLPSACAVDTAHTFSAAAGLLSISAAAASPTLTQLYTPASPRSVFKLQARRRMKQEILDAFLKHHNFRDPLEPSVRISRLSCLPSLPSETVYPIHVAARLADVEVVRLLLKERADPWQKTSAGRSPVEIACESDKFGSHREVCDILRGKVKLLPMREFLAWSS